MRRAKSTSSTHTSSSGHQRTRTSIDPFVTRQQAETAALEAYHRAREQEEPACADYRPVPPKLPRRRSQVSGRSEGSHLEDFRLGRRNSNSKKENVKKVKPAVPHQISAKTTIEGSEGDEISIRRRYVVPTNPRNRQMLSEHASIPSFGRHARRSEPGYANGSPIPRNSSEVKEQSSTLRLRTTRGEQSHGSTDNLSLLSNFGEANHCTSSTRDATQQGINSLDAARAKCLQDFHHHKLCERKSFMLAPLQKLRSATVTKNSGSNFDTKLPPFNYTDELVPPPSIPPIISAPPIAAQKKSRNFSDSLKGRFKKVFRKPSRAPSGLPVQHIEAKDFRFSTYATPSISTTSRHDDPFIAVSDQQSIATQEFKTASVSTRGSADEQSTAKSRVTSWTNSTIGDTLSTRNGAEFADFDGEHAKMKRSDSLLTLRKTPSLFGRSIKSRLRRPSRAKLRGSDESAGLYSALQERIQPPKSVIQISDVDQDSLSTTISALATLPSQQRANSSMSSNRRGLPPTIRSITPEPNLYKLEIPSPVLEVLSPPAPTVEPAVRSDEHYDRNPRSHLQRRPAVKAPTPSKEQIARRMEKSKNRWQSPLDEMSPPPPTAGRAAMTEDNPYELRPLNRTLQQPVIGNDLPHHAKVAEKLPSTRYDVLSPSVYSRETNGDTPQPDSPVDKGDMMVTITGREVRSYSISPAKRGQQDERPVQGSADWRRWLSSEINGLNDSSGLDEFSLPKTMLKDSEPARVSADQVSEPPRMMRHGQEDQYLYSTHDKDVSSDNQQSNADQLNQTDDGNSNNTVDQTAANGNISAHVNTTSNTQALNDSRKAGQRANQATHATSERHYSGDVPTRPLSKEPRTTYKPRSAFDLRANYKTNSLEKAKPIAVRRKSSKNINNIHILEDTTIQNISAGPYASSQQIASSHANNKENSPPPSEANTLPIVSSSEWLAAGTNKKRDIKGASSVRPGAMSRSRSISRHSPSRSPSTIVPSDGSSPGQRMVTNWLDGKREKEGSLAFV